ncbi:MAG: D-amino-acid transaminase [Alphaproteobacteria bacterium]|nr:D-amino-acid transaminase [Alphaproteobacteria bacterium]
MSRIAYVNGQYLPHREAAVHFEDRGYQFADGVYEVFAVRGGRLVDHELHYDRLDYSLRELAIEAPVSRPVLLMIIEEVIRRNRVTEGIAYLQITRGVAPRDHGFPKTAVPPALIVSARNMQSKEALRRTGVAVICVPDLRWKRRDIKTISLLPNIMAKQMAVEAGAYEALQVDEDGTITEGTATNAWIVTDKGELVTRKTDRSILSGITRLTAITLARSAQLKLVERPFTVAEAKDACEAFLTSTTSDIMPIISIDGAEINGGKPGPITKRLGELYETHAVGA